MNRLKELRKNKGVTQKEIADYIGISQNTYSCWETGKIKIDNISVVRLADYFNVSVDYILGRNFRQERQDNKNISVNSREEELVYAFRTLGRRFGTKIQDDFLRLLNNFKD